jgi:hypothetical protein
VISTCHAALSATSQAQCALKDPHADSKIHFKGCLFTLTTYKVNE